jgi:hypothetical protein
MYKPKPTTKIRELMSGTNIIAAIQQAMGAMRAKS